MDVFGESGPLSASRVITVLHHDGTQTPTRGTVVRLPQSEGELDGDFSPSGANAWIPTPINTNRAEFLDETNPETSVTTRWRVLDTENEDGPFFIVTRYELVQPMVDPDTVAPVDPVDPVVPVTTDVRAVWSTDRVITAADFAAPGAGTFMSNTFAIPAHVGFDYLVIWRSTASGGAPDGIEFDGQPQRGAFDADGRALALSGTVGEYIVSLVQLDGDDIGGDDMELS